MKKTILALSITLCMLGTAACSGNTSNENETSLQPTESITVTDTVQATTKENLNVTINNNSYTLSKRFDMLEGTPNITTGSNLNVRDIPSTDGEIIAKLNSSSKFYVLGETNNWWYVDIGSKKGFISKEFAKFNEVLMVVKSTFATSTNSYSQGKLIKVIPSKDNFYYIKEGDNLSKVDYNLLEDSQRLKASLYSKFSNQKGILLLSDYTTHYTLDDDNRNTNISLACSSIDSCILLPGEEFNWEELIGPANEAQGYKKAGVIENGEFKSDFGGGICQVSTTLYNACVNADLKITERHTHSKDVSYVPKGMDATVSYGTLNYKFVNSTNLPIIVKAYTKDGNLKVAIYSIEY